MFLLTKIASTLRLPIKILRSRPEETKRGRLPREPMIGFYRRQPVIGWLLV
jgi:hypothetical protein